MKTPVPGPAREAPECPAAVTARRGAARLLAAVVPAIGWSLACLAPSCAADGGGPDVWLVSTRTVPACASPEQAAGHFYYWRLAPDRTWQPAERSDLLDGGAPLPTTFYIHGNRADPQSAVRQGWVVYRCLRSRAGERPFRFVIWSWPAERTHRRMLVDLRVKAARSDVQAQYVAWLVSRMPAEAPVNMVGYSYGARVITGALEMLGGGEVAGRRLDAAATSDRRRVWAVLVAAAIDNDWLLPGRRNGRAVTRAESVLITRNRCDRALKWYPAVCRTSGAMGFTGPVCLRGMGDEASKLEVVDVSCRVGKAHDWRVYLQAPELWARLPSYALPADDAPPEAAPPIASAGPEIGDPSDGRDAHAPGRLGLVSP